MPLISYVNNTSDGEGDGMAEEASNENDTSIISGKCLKYFACQGPVESTVSDFWALLWQEQVHVVAMLTQTQEAGKLKCYPYWPQNKSDVVSVDNGCVFYSSGFEDLLPFLRLIRLNFFKQQNLQVKILRWYTWKKDCIY